MALPHQADANERDCGGNQQQAADGKAPRGMHIADKAVDAGYHDDQSDRNHTGHHGNNTRGNQQLAALILIQRDGTEDQIRSIEGGAHVIEQIEKDNPHNSDPVGSAGRDKEQGRNADEPCQN